MSANESGFVVERKINDGNWEEYGKTVANALSFVDILTQYDTKYSYRVRSFTTIGKSNPSDSVTYTTPNDPNTGISDQSANVHLAIFPNPAHNQITLISKEPAQIKIFDLQGKVVWEQSNSKPTETINISDFSNGIYFLQALSDRKSNVIKLVKE